MKLSLLIDIGNSQIKWALVERSTTLTFYAEGYTATHTDTLNALVAQIASHVAKSGKNVISEISYCCVASRVIEAELLTLLEQKFSVSVLAIKVKPEAAGVKNAYRDPEQLGVDRWVGALGAKKRLADLANLNIVGEREASLNAIVIDAGTAITVDYLSSEDVFLGGVILPGAHLMSEALNQRTARIMANDEVAQSPFGVTTSMAVGAGIHFGLPGAVATVVEQMVAERPEPTVVILCGGGAVPVLDALVRRWKAASVEGQSHYYRPTDMKQIDLVCLEPNLLFYGLIALSSPSA